MFEIKNLSKQYGAEFALDDVTMTIGTGMNFIIGSSGSGKTTLLKILGGMEQGYEGSVTYLGKDISDFSDKEKSALYNSMFGFVWQDFHLLEEATVFENIMVPTYLKNEKAEEAAERILKQVKLEDMRNQKVNSLSGGQKQRVAIARELMKNPQVILCDEPTSALDAKSAKSIMELLRSLSKNRTVIVVTHDTSLIDAKDSVFELDKGELVATPENRNENRGAHGREKEQKKLTAQKPAGREAKAPAISFGRAAKLAFTNMKNKPGRFLVSAVSLVLAGVLLLTTLSGAIGESGQSEFDKLVETYGEGILDISLVGSFMSASGGDAAPGGSVNQDIGGLYEKYQDDKRVEFIVSSQAFENIEITMDGNVYTVEQTGSTPVLTKLLSGSVPSGEEFQVVVPAKFAESIGLTPDSALGKKMHFSATIYKWIGNQPIAMPVELEATICGVADNTVVYDYEGKTYTHTVDDSFFFNKAAIEDIRRQAEIEGNSANFILRAKTPADLIELKDEINRMGIVPLGRFELVEDIVRLNEQTAEQSGSASIVIGVLAVLLAVIISVMTSVLRKREYAIYKVSGFGNGHLTKLFFAETLFTTVCASVLLLITSPLLSKATEAMFDASILSAEKLLAGVVLVSFAAVIAFVAELPAVFATSVSDMLKAGDKA